MYILRVRSSVFSSPVASNALIRSSCWGSRLITGPNALALANKSVCEVPVEDARHTAEAVLLDRYGLTRLVISTLIDGAHDAHVVSAAALNGTLRQETSVDAT